MCWQKISSILFCFCGKHWLFQSEACGRWLKNAVRFWWDESSFNVSHTLMQTEEFRHLKNNFQISTNKYQLCWNIRVLPWTETELHNFELDATKIPCRLLESTCLVKTEMLRVNDVVSSPFGTSSFFGINEMSKSEITLKIARGRCEGPELKGTSSRQSLVPGGLRSPGMAAGGGKVQAAVPGWEPARAPSAAASAQPFSSFPQEMPVPGQEWQLAQRSLPAFQRPLCQPDLATPAWSGSWECTNYVLMAGSG